MRPPLGSLLDVPVAVVALTLGAGFAWLFDSLVVGLAVVAATFFVALYERRKGG